MTTSLRSLAPCPRLRPFVRHYWILQSMAAHSALTFPVGCPQLIFHRKNPLYIPELKAAQPSFAVSGQVNFPATLQSTGELEMIVVVFKPHAATLFGIPVSAFYNQEISGYELGDRALDDLAARVVSANTLAEGVGVVETWLLSRLNLTKLCYFNCIGESLRMLFGDSHISVKGMADAACFSARQYERVFFGAVGMKPKEYSRIARFQKSLWLIQNSVRDYCEIAFRCGYSDQSHYIRECREYSGLTPAELIASQPVYSDLFSSPV